MWCGQFTDIAIDSSLPQYYIGIECKSIQTKKLYFSAHFQPEQVSHMNDFLDKSGRNGYLGLEFRHRGTKSEAYLIPWTHIRNKFDNNIPGISKDDINTFTGVIPLIRGKDTYTLSSF
jgi:Holliday junction resolvase